MPAPEILDAVRVVATPDAIAALASDGVVLQIAPDEALVLDAIDVSVDDVHAISLPDDGFAGVQLPRRQVEEWCAREAEWPLPDVADYFVQGLVAGLAVKIWVHGENALVICRTSARVDLEARL